MSNLATACTLGSLESSVLSSHDLKNEYGRTNDNVSANSQLITADRIAYINDGQYVAIFVLKRDDCTSDLEKLVLRSRRYIMREGGAVALLPVLLKSFSTTRNTDLANYIVLLKIKDGSYHTDVSKQTCTAWF